MAQDKIEITAELKDLISGQFQKINDQVNKLENSLKSVDNVGSRAGGNGFWNMDTSIMAGVTAGNLLTNAITGAAGAVVDFGKQTVEEYSKTESYEARLATLLGSRRQALMALNTIKSDAAKTPFDVESLVQGNSLLIGAGANAGEARKSIMDLGNAIAATGGGADELNRMSVNLAQIRTLGKASALDIKQFAYANIPIYQLLSKSMNKPIEEVKKLDVSYKDLTKALSDARAEGGMFHNGLENASNTLKGLNSNLDDTIASLKSNIGETFADNLKEGLRAVLPVLDDINETLGRINKSSRVLNESGLGFKWYESNTERGELGAYKQKLDEISAFGMSGDKESIKAKATLQSELKRLTEDYQNNLALSEGTGEKAPDAQRYLRQVALLKDTIAGLNEGLSGMSKDKEGKDSAKTESKASDLEKVAKANRPTQVNINIENLVREYTNEFNTAAEALKMTPETVARVLIGAVNDISTLQFGS